VGHGIEITSFRYGREDQRVETFQNGDKCDTVERWRQLDEMLEAVFE